MTHQDEILFANEAYYAAFAGADLKAMKTIWLDGETTSCIHPGWSALHGSELILQTYGKIFANDKAIASIECHGAQINHHGDLALVTCYEVLDGTVLAATNIFMHINRSWKMIHHQASPVNVPELDDDEDEDFDEADEEEMTKDVLH